MSREPTDEEMEAVTKIETRAAAPQVGLVCITNSDAVRYKTVIPHS
jgi:hypothetical protein